jgi:hypothetical protein
MNVSYFWVYFAVTKITNDCSKCQTSNINSRHTVCRYTWRSRRAHLATDGGEVIGIGEEVLVNVSASRNNKTKQLAWLNYELWCRISIAKLQVFQLFTIPMYTYQLSRLYLKKVGKAVQLQAWTGPDGFRKLKFPDFVTTAQDGCMLYVVCRFYPKEILLVLISIRG